MDEIKFTNIPQREIENMKDNLISKIQTVISESRDRPRWQNYGTFFSMQIAPRKYNEPKVTGSIDLHVGAAVNGDGFETSLGFQGGFASDWANQFFREIDLKTPIKGMTSTSDYRPVIQKMREDEMKRLEPDLLKLIEKNNAEFKKIMEKHGYKQKRHNR